MDNWIRISVTWKMSSDKLHAELHTSSRLWAMEAQRYSLFQPYDLSALWIILLYALSPFVPCCWCKVLCCLLLGKKWGTHNVVFSLIMTVSLNYFRFVASRSEHNIKSSRARLVFPPRKERWCKGKCNMFSLIQKFMLSNICRSICHFRET